MLLTILACIGCLLGLCMVILILAAIWDQLLLVALIFGFPVFIAWSIDFMIERFK